MPPPTTETRVHPSLSLQKGIFSLLLQKALDSPPEIDYTHKSGPDNDFVKYRHFQYEDDFPVRASLKKRHINVTSFDRIDTLYRLFMARKQGSGMQGKLSIQDLARQASISKTAAAQIFNQNTSFPLLLHTYLICVMQEHNFLQLLYPLS